MLKTVSTAFCSIGVAISTAAAFELPELDVARTSFNYSGDMDFRDEDGSMSLTQFELQTLLSKPIEVVENVNIVPMFGYKNTNLNFENVGANNEELHSLNLSALLFAGRDDSPWIFVGWGRAELATDFQAISSDDLTYDIAGAAAYRFNKSFILAAGGAMANLNGDSTFYPVIGFDWIINEKTRMGLYGPVFVASYTPCEDWEFSVRGDSIGNIWNISDDQGRSRSYNLYSYRLGIFAGRRLKDQLWLTAGVGATFGNQLELTTPDGDEIFDEEMESGFFGQLGLRLKVW